MLTLSLSHFLILGAILFAISVVGIFLNRKNLLVLLMAIELMLLAVNMNFVAFSHFLGDLSGQVFVFFISQHQARFIEARACLAIFTRLLYHRLHLRALAAQISSALIVVAHFHEQPVDFFVTRFNCS